MRPTLHRLARLHGIQAAYTDGCGVRRRAAPEAIRALLRGGGGPAVSHKQPKHVCAPCGPDR